ncbi:DUF6292 family protein [Nonomuraea sp. NPDC005983]|uniref:DUF6292 family protein n=1 Tax=Nonomuraea sp. NPDC005983 TaxID=3155595 RepID=UPI0033B1C115
MIGRICSRELAALEPLSADGAPRWRRRAARRRGRSHGCTAHTARTAPPARREAARPAAGPGERGTGFARPRSSLGPGRPGRSTPQGQQRVTGDGGRRGRIHHRPRQRRRPRLGWDEERGWTLVEVTSVHEFGPTANTYFDLCLGLVPEPAEVAHIVKQVLTGDLSVSTGQGRRLRRSADDDGDLETVLAAYSRGN